MAAKVFDLAAARGRHTGQPGANRHATQLQAGQMRRADMRARPPFVVWARKPDGTVVLAKKRPVARKVRRGGDPKPPRALRVLDRRARRLAWKVERRNGKTVGITVGWWGSRSRRGELAPVIPIGCRTQLAGTVRRAQAVQSGNQAA